MWLRGSIAVVLSLGTLLRAHVAVAQSPKVGAPKPSSVRAQAGQSISAVDAQRLQRALADYDAGNLIRARPVLVGLAARYPQHGETQAAAGMTLAELGDVSGAVPYLQRAHRLRPGDANVAVNLAVAEMKIGHAAEAVPLLEAASREQPREASLRVSLAEARLAAGDPEGAARSFAEADALPHAEDGVADADLRHDWAVALLQAKRAPEALAVLQATPGVNGLAALQPLLAEAEEKTGHFEAAVTHFKRAAELEPSEVNLHAYGNELMQHWTFPAAIEIFTYAAKQYPASERLRMGLGIAYFGNSAYDKAVPVFHDLLLQHPESAPAADLLGRSCSALSGSHSEGCASLRPFAEAHPNNAPASLYAAIAILHQPADKQDGAAAEKLLRNALRADPKMAEAWYQLAVLQQSRNEWQPSADSLGHALAARPGYAEAHYRLARAYSHLGKRDEAQTEIALQQRYAAETKAAENKRMQEVMTFLTTSN